MYYHPIELYKHPLDQNKIDALTKRHNLLNSSDWTQMPDVDLMPEVKQAWVTYRQALRDITDQPNFPDEITWPVSPNGHS